MTPQESQLETLRDTVAAYLASAAAFAGVTVVTRRDGDIINTLTTKIAETGVAVEVSIKSAQPTKGQGFAVVLDPVVLGLTAYENVLVNQDPTTGTGKGAYWLNESALVALKLWTPPGFSNVIMPDPAGPQRGRDDKMPTVFILTQDFNTTLQLAARTS